jgi:5-formyltetrahydrofolate cyclo-ligase
MQDNMRASIRRHTKIRREGLSKLVIKEKSNLIIRRLRQFDIYRYAKHLALYRAVRGEVALTEVWDTAPFQGKQCYFPVLDNEKLIFLPATPKSKFTENKYGILEPDVDRKEAVKLEELDLVLMPLVAFDPFCNRLGMGKGYYDKTFSVLDQSQRVNVHLLGIAYDFQCYDVLPSQSWDVPLDGVLTENHIYRSAER